MDDRPFARLLSRRVDRRRALALSGGTGAALAFAAAGIGLAASACGNEVQRPEGWADASHAKRPDPDYDRVFPRDRINELSLTVAPEHWAAMLANLATIFGPRGPSAAPAGSPGLRPVGERREKPVWVPATVAFGGSRWHHVGLRFKGNSSLFTPWRQGADRVPFKLDFDQFEDEHPEVKGQRFFGFKQVSLANNFRDATHLRETVAYDLIADAGLVAARTALYKVTLDYGDGPRSIGLYTLMEVIDDTVVRRSFAGSRGYLYEAEGRGATLSASSVADIETSFTPKRGTKLAGWNGLRALHTALHDPSRVRAPAAWRSNLEAAFDVDAFLTWLGLSTTIQHWDTYGQMYHNFYLYEARDTGRVTWISWDHNFVLGRLAGGAAAVTAKPGDSATFEKSAVTSSWPLIRFLLDDPVYRARYADLLRTVSSRVFDVTALLAKYDRWAQLVAPHVGDATAQAAHGAAMADLAAVTRERGDALRAFLTA